MRKVFFSFKYEDVSRAMIVRNSWVTQGKTSAGFIGELGIMPTVRVTQGKTSAGFIDKADFEKVKKQGDQAIKNWINKQLDGTSVTVVLVGEKTCRSRWVKYEIEQSINRGNGLLGIDISKIKDLQGNITERCGKISNGYDFYLWHKDDGYNNLGNWIEKAAK